MKTTLKQITNDIPTLFKAGVVPFLHSSPAIGKSSVAKQLANQYKLKVIDLRLTEYDSVDLNGLPKLDTDKARYIPFDTFPLENTPIPKGYNGWLLLLDEFNSALPSVQVAAYKLVLDRMVGQYPLNKKVAIIACGNLDTDNAIVNTMSSALISRFAHFYIELNNKEWQEWAINHGIDITLTSFLNFKPDLLYTFNPDTSEPYASPRTWEMLNNVLKVNKNPSLVLLASLLGDGVASEFSAYMKYWQSLPSVKDILDKPHEYPVPTDIAVQWATIGMLVEQINTDVTKTVQYLKRFPMELHLVALSEIKGRYPELLRNGDITDWMFEVSSKIN